MPSSRDRPHANPRLETSCIEANELEQPKWRPFTKILKNEKFQIAPEPSCERHKIVRQIEENIIASHEIPMLSMESTMDNYFILLVFFNYLFLKASHSECLSLVFRTGAERIEHNSSRMRPEGDLGSPRVGCDSPTARALL